MSPPEARDAATVVDMIRACSEVIEYVRGVEQTAFQTDRRLISAVSYQIAVLGEAAMRLSASIRDRYPNVPWRDIAGMRHHLIHGYDQVALVEVWRTAVTDVPLLLDQLKAIERDLA